MTDDLVILVPVLNRPHRVKPLLDSIEQTTPKPYRVLFLTDKPDRREREAIREAGAEELPVGGTWAHKINEGVKATSESLILFGADDLEFQPNWLQEAKKALLKDEKFEVVGTEDLGHPDCPDKFAPHPLVKRSYVRRGTVDDPESVLHEGYGHWCVDVEFAETAQMRGAWVPAKKSVIRHLHPGFGRRPSDRTDEKGRRSMGQDRKLLDVRRERLWANGAMDVSIVVATYGTDPFYSKMAERALSSVEHLDYPVFREHLPNGTLADARNAGLKKTKTEFVCHLDADDFLEPGYFSAMGSVEGDIRVPARRWVPPVFDPPYIPKVGTHKHDCTGECLRLGNWIVVGAVANTSLCKEVGGWRDLPALEDWDLWLRMWRAGATIARQPSAIYRAYRWGRRQKAFEDESIEHRHNVMKEIVVN